MTEYRIKILMSTDNDMETLEEIEWMSFDTEEEAKDYLEDYEWISAIIVEED